MRIRRDRNATSVVQYILYIHATIKDYYIGKKKVLLNELIDSIQKTILSDGIKKVEDGIPILKFSEKVEILRRIFRFFFRSSLFPD